MGPRSTLRKERAGGWNGGISEPTAKSAEPYVDALQL